MVICSWNLHNLGKTPGPLSYLGPYENHDETLFIALREKMVRNKKPPCQRAIIGKVNILNFVIVNLSISARNLE